MVHEDNTPRPHKKSGKAADDITPIGADFSKIEYAIQRKILEAPLLELSYYTDVVGEVPSHSEQTDHIGIESIDIGNGDISPEWGIDLIISGGFLKYGPWADRQRWVFPIPESLILNLSLKGRSFRRHSFLPRIKTGKSLLCCIQAIKGRGRHYVFLLNFVIALHCKFHSENHPRYASCALFYLL